MEIEEKNNKIPNPKDPQNKENDEFNLEVGNSDLSAVLAGEEEILQPPPEDENEAKEINVGNIIAFISILVIVILLIIVISSGNGHKKNREQKDLDKAGTKYEVDFNAQKEDQQGEIERQVDQNFGDGKRKKTDDEVLKNLPPELRQQDEPGIAPVARVGSTSSKSQRPDTRNSKSPRKIEGIKGQGAPNTNSNIVSAVMNGNYNSYTSNRMSKEEFFDDKMKQMQSFQYQIPGYGNKSVMDQTNKDNFYGNNSGYGGDGQYMSYNSLWDGTIISGALITAINTDNPGVVIARVTENVYSSYDHSMLLIPEGSLLYATYNSSISYGQDKVQVAWNLLIRPDGYRITLGNMNGVNGQGESGYKGRVSNHTWQTMKAFGMIALYSMIQTEVSRDIKTEKNEYMKNAMTDVYAEAQKLGNKILDRALDIKPTITIKAGTEIKLITNIPLELPPVKINQVTRKYVRTR